MKNAILSSDFKIDNVVISPPTIKSYETNGGGKFTEGPISYKYPNGSESYLRVIFPNTLGAKPINIPKDPKFKPSLQISLSGEHAADYFTVFEGVHELSLDWLVQNAKKLGTIGSKIKSREAANVVSASPIFHHAPSEDGIERPPTRYLDFFWSRDGSEITTPIKLVNGTTVPFEFLKGKSFEFIPTVWIRRVYIGAKCKVHCYVDNLLVTKIVESAPTSSIETDIMQKLAITRKEDTEQMMRLLEGFTTSSAGGSKSSSPPVGTVDDSNGEEEEGGVTDSSSSNNVTKNKTSASGPVVAKSSSPLRNSSDTANSSVTKNRWESSGVELDDGNNAEEATDDDVENDNEASSQPPPPAPVVAKKKFPFVKKQTGSE